MNRQASSSSSSSSPSSPYTTAPSPSSFLFSSYSSSILLTLSLLLYSQVCAGSFANLRTFHEHILHQEYELGLHHMEHLYQHGKIDTTHTHHMFSVQGLQQLNNIYTPNGHHSQSHSYHTSSSSSSSSSSSLITHSIPILPFATTDGTVQTRWFNQTLDHFSAQDTRTFSQRYYVNMNYYGNNPVGSPVFVYIGGEGELKNSSLVNGEIVERAKVHKAALLALEHRFYGQSQPFATLDTANLKFLSSQQALADLAEFVSFMLESNSWQAQNVVVFGGSYPGSLSAWFRIKFPQLAAASLASSAPLLAKTDFYEYDQVVAASAGPACSSAIRRATKEVTARLDADAISTMRSFGCGAVDPTDKTGFLYVLADAVAYAIQYSTERPGPRYHLREDLCNSMQNATQDAYDGYASFVNRLFFKLNTTCVDFSTLLVTLQDTSTDASKNQRQWYYQSCTEFGWFQTAPQNNSLRSDRITLQYHLDLCHQAFGLPLVPAVMFTNNYYGGIAPRGSRIVLPNGSLDPWNAMGMLNPQSCCPTLVPIMITGTSHCADLYAPDPQDPASLVQAREAIANYISFWLSNPESGGLMCPSYLTMCNGVCIDTQSNPNHCGACGNAVDLNHQVCILGAPTAIVAQTVVGKELLILGGSFLLVGFITMMMGVAAFRKSRHVLTQQNINNINPEFQQIRTDRLSSY